MIPEKAFERLLGLDECWEVVAAEYETEPSERFLLLVRETAQLWPKLVCAVGKCGGREVVCHDHTEARAWRHLDAFGKRTEIVCAPPRARCGAYRHVWRVPVPWEGEGKHFTRDFEAFALTLMREMPMKKAGEILGEHDTRKGVSSAFGQLLSPRRRLSFMGLQFCVWTTVEPTAAFEFHGASSDSGCGGSGFAVSSYS